jgi:RecJ-like exonuclease
MQKGGKIIMKEPLGSEIFGTSNIKTSEYVLMAKVWKESGSPIEEIDADLRMIDDCLGLIRIRQLIRSQQFTPTGKLRKDATLMAMINGRIDLRIQESNEYNKEIN